MYWEGTEIKEKKVADFCFKINMYLLIKRKSPFDSYKWKTLDRVRKKLADVYFSIVDVYGEEAFLA